MVSKQNKRKKISGCNLHSSAPGIPVDSFISGIKFVDEHLFSLLTELWIFVEDFFYDSECPFWLKCAPVAFVSILLLT